MHTTECHLCTVNLFNPQKSLSIAYSQQRRRLQILLIAYLRQPFEPLNLTLVTWQPKYRELRRVVSPVEDLILVRPLHQVLLLVPNLDTL